MKTLCSDLKRSRIALILILALFLGSLFQPAVNTQAEATTGTVSGYNFTLNSDNTLTLNRYTTALQTMILLFHQQ
jgi:hypothetical protein